MDAHVGSSRYAITGAQQRGLRIQPHRSRYTLLRHGKVSRGWLHRDLDLAERA